MTNNNVNDSFDNYIDDGLMQFNDVGGTADKTLSESAESKPNAIENGNVVHAPGIPGGIIPSVAAFEEAKSISEDLTDAAKNAIEESFYMPDDMPNTIKSAIGSIEDNADASGEQINGSLSKIVDGLWHGSYIDSLGSTMKNSLHNIYDDTRYLCKIFYGLFKYTTDISMTDKEFINLLDEEPAADLSLDNTQNNTAIESDAPINSEINGSNVVNNNGSGGGSSSSYSGSVGSIGSTTIINNNSVDEQEIKDYLNKTYGLNVDIFTGNSGVMIKIIITDETKFNNSYDEVYQYLSGKYTAGVECVFYNQNGTVNRVMNKSKEGI